MRTSLLFWVMPSIFMVLLAVLDAYAETKSELTIVFPDVDAPYDAIFQQINSGIEKEYPGPVKKLKLPKSFDASEVATTIASDNVIALGKRGLSVAKALDDNKTIVVGALPLRPGKISGVSLMAHPASLFDSLQDLSPKTKKIIVVYSDASAWIMPIAQKEADKRNLVLESFDVSDIESAVKKYTEIFSNKKLENAAIWLSLDSIASNDRVILPEILKKSWKNKMIIFSSKPTHAKRGALFSAIPDNNKLGSQLVSLIESDRINGYQGTVVPSSSIKLAVNLRTAKHLGLKYSRKKRASFALTFN